MVDFDELRNGKDQDAREGVFIDGVYYPNIRLIKALAKTLIQKGVCTKAELKANLG